MNSYKAREKQMKILNILFAIVVYMISFAYPSFANQPKFFIKSVDTNSEIKARMVLFVGATLAFTFTVIVCGVMYALVFVTQPIDQQSPNDKAFIDSLLVPIVLFLSGCLSGVLAANGLKDKETKPTDSGYQIYDQDRS